jgi:hypothetical protein
MLLVSDCVIMADPSEFLLRPSLEHEEKRKASLDLARW